MGSGVVGFLRAKNIPITTKLLMEIQNNEKEAVKRIAQKYGVLSGVKVYERLSFRGNCAAVSVIGVISRENNVV